MSENIGDTTMYIRAVQAANVYMDNNNLKRYKKVTEGSGKNKVVKYEAMNTYCHITDDELYSAMSAFEEKGILNTNS